MQDRRTVPPPGVLVLMMALMCLVGCDAPGGSASVPRLAHGAADLDALGAVVWDAAVAGDTAGLERLRLSEYEHNELVWPEQPAARAPGAAENLDYWWRNIEVRNRAALRRLLSRHADSPLEFVGTDCPGEPRRFETFRALTGCRLLVRGQDRVARVRLFRQVVEMDGRYKVVRYDAG